MFKWYAKYFFSTVLGILPYKHIIHNKIQSLFGSGGLDEEEMISRVIELYSLSFKFKDSLENANVLEIGTGWYPYIPIVAYLYGAKSVVTVDLNPWLTIKTFRLTVKSVIKNKAAIISIPGITYEGIDERFNTLNEIVNENLNLSTSLKRLGVEYLPKFDVCNLKIEEDKKFNLILSSNVLEHIPIKTLSRIHSHLLQISANDCIAVHRFNPADHFANLSGSTISFLSIPDNFWRLLGGNGISFHNRLRSREHANLVINSFWKILFWADAVDERAKTQIMNNTIKLNDKYKEMDLDTICAFYSWFVLKLGKQNNFVKPKIVKWITDVI